MAYDDSVFWFMESSFPLYCKGQLISLSPGWRPVIMPADIYLLPIVRVHCRKWAQQTGCVWGGRGARLEWLLCGIPRFLSVRNSRSAHTPGRIRDEGEYRNSTWSNSNRRLIGIKKYFFRFSCLTEVSSHDCANNNVSKIMLGTEIILIPFNNGTDAADACCPLVFNCKRQLFTISVLTRTCIRRIYQNLFLAWS